MKAELHEQTCIQTCLQTKHIGTETHSLYQLQLLIPIMKHNSKMKVYFCPKLSFFG